MLTFPVTPEQTLLKKLENFAQSVYTLNPTDHLYNLMSVLLGPVGAGQLAQVQDAARNTQNLHDALYSDIDYIFGNLLNIARQSSEEYGENINPFIDQLTQDQWDNVLFSDASYKERIKLILQGLQKGGSPQGIELIAQGILGVPVSVVESSRFPTTNILDYNTAGFVSGVGHWTSTGALSLNTSTSLSFGSSLQLKSTSSGENTLSLDKYFPVNPSTEYTLIASFKALNSASAPVSLTLTFYSDTNGTVVGTPATTSLTSVETGWTQGSLNSTSPSNAAYAKISVSYTLGSSFPTYYLMDNVSLAPGTSTQWTTGYFGKFQYSNTEFVIIPKLPPNISALSQEVISDIYDGILMNVKPINTVMTMSAPLSEGSSIGVRRATADSEWFQFNRDVTAPQNILSSDNTSTRYWLQPGTNTQAPTFAAITLQEQQIDVTGNVANVSVTITTTSGTVQVNQNTLPVSQTQYGPWQQFALADSPDNYPNGKYPGDASKYNAAGVYMFPWVSQSAYVTYETSLIESQGGQVQGDVFRLPINNASQPIGLTSGSPSDIMSPQTITISSTAFGGI